jgi:hypothetical protein
MQANPNAIIMRMVGRLKGWTAGVNRQQVREQQKFQADGVTDLGSWFSRNPPVSWKVLDFHVTDLIA